VADRNNSAGLECRLFNVLDKTPAGKCAQCRHATLSRDQVGRRQRFAIFEKFSSLHHSLPTGCRKATEGFTIVAKSPDARTIQSL
jgi:hypothetical protein